MEKINNFYTNSIISATSSCVSRRSRRVFLSIRLILDQRQLALDGEAANYYRYMEYRRNHEVNFSEMTEKELDSIFVIDEYKMRMDILR